MSRTARRRVFVLTFPADLWPLAGWKSVPPKCVLALKAKLHLFIFVPAASVNLKRTSLSFVGVNLGFCENQNVCWVIWCLDRIGRSECWRVCGKFVQQLHKHRHSNSNQIGFINTHTQKRQRNVWAVRVRTRWRLVSRPEEQKHKQTRSSDFF